MEHSEGNQGKYWFYTHWPVAERDEEELFNPFSFKKIPGVLLHIYQLEAGATEGEHYQGLLYFAKNCRFNKLKAANQYTSWFLKSELSKHEQVIHYVTKPHPLCECKHCVKDGYRVAGPWEEGDKEPFLNQVKNIWKDIFKDIGEGMSEFDVMQKYPGNYSHGYRAVEKARVLYEEKKMLEENKKEMEEYVIRDWQVDVWTKLQAQDKRKVLWVVDGEGKHGKSELADYLEMVYGAYRCGASKIEDIKYLYKKEEYVVIDFERADQEKVQYGLIEQFKNGKIVSTKYTPEKKYKKAKVVVFANWEPDKSGLSDDRWDIMIITPGQDYVKSKKDDYTKYDFSDRGIDVHKAI